MTNDVMAMLSLITPKKEAEKRGRDSLNRGDLSNASKKAISQVEQWPETPCLRTSPSLGHNT